MCLDTWILSILLRWGVSSCSVWNPHVHPLGLRGSLWSIAGPYTSCHVSPRLSAEMVLSSFARALAAGGRLSCSEIYPESSAGVMTELWSARRSMCCEKGKIVIASFNRNHCDFLLSGLSLKWAETTVYTRPSGLSKLVRSRRGEMEADATSVQSFCHNSATPPPWCGGGVAGPYSHSHAV